MTNTSNLERRIDQLEQKIGSDPIVLVLPDGSERTLPGTTKHFHKLCESVSDAESPLAGELQLLRDAVTIEGSASEMFSLLAALAQGPKLPDPNDPSLNLGTKKPDFSCE